jgi:predicted nucleic acid-binding protein
MVFDASVIVKVLTEEAMTGEALAAVIAESDRLAPDLLMVEVASALSKKARYFGLPRPAIDDALAALPDILTDQVSSLELLPLALDLSIELRHALQDCIYLALAIERDCPLITDDEKFAAVVAASSHAGRVVRLRQK